MNKDNNKILRCANYNLSLDRPRIMGVLNVTPDSFSDGGLYSSPADAISHGLALLDQGADIIDVGGESTRPGFSPVDCQEEARRVAPVVQGLAERGAIVSIDTRHPAVAELCVNLGASIINDVEGFSNPDMIQVASKSNVGCIVMHSGSCTKPNTTHKRVSLDDAKSNLDELNDLMNTTHYNASLDVEDYEVVRNVKGFLFDRVRELEKAGVSPERICIDPGTGFGKSAQEDFILQRSISKLSSLGYPLLCAVSRKRMTSAILGPTDPQVRDATTAGMCVGALEQGAHIFRVHNVEMSHEVIEGYWQSTHCIFKQALIALGSNVGDRVGYLQKALKSISKIPLTEIVSVSNAYDTEPAYGIESSVVDAVCMVKTQLHPLALLKHLQEIENALGRIRQDDMPHFAPRTIDLDLLWMEGELHAGDLLELPHPRMGEREFVVCPMADVVGDAEGFFHAHNISLEPQDKRVGKITQDLGKLEY